MKKETRVMLIYCSIVGLIAIQLSNLISFITRFYAFWFNPLIGLVFYFTMLNSFKDLKQWIEKQIK